MKGIFVLYNIGLILIYRKMEAKGPKLIKREYSAAILENGG
jgi:hypothetical protein